MKYSQRILETADLLQCGKVLADIGCDHGYVSILAVNGGKYQKVYACDVAEGPLKRAKENISNAGLEGEIFTILSDGFQNVPGDIDCAVICGMGGLLICNILKNGSEKIQNLKQLILGPHSETEQLRKFILETGMFNIYQETTLIDAGKFYQLLDVRSAQIMNYENKEYYIDPLNIRYGNVENQKNKKQYHDYLNHELNKLIMASDKIKQGKSSRASSKSLELENEIEALKRLIINTERSI